MQQRLAAEAVDLLVLRPRDVALLRDERLLQGADALVELLAGADRAARDLLANLPFHVLRLAADALLKRSLQVRRRGGIGAPDEGPQSEHDEEREQADLQPFERHAPLSQRPRGSLPAGTDALPRRVDDPARHRVVCLRRVRPAAAATRAPSARRGRMPSARRAPT